MISALSTATVTQFVLIIENYFVKIFCGKFNRNMSSCKIPQEVLDSELGRGGVPKGARTSEYYRTKSIPERFDNPDSFEGYNTKPMHPMYRTTNSDYGSHQPSVHTMPTTFRTLSQAFTRHLGQCGMYRNHSFNTGEDKTKVPEF